MAWNAIAYLRRQNVTFIEPDMWPSNSPDLNLVNYAIWVVLQERLHRGRKFENMEQLKQAIVLEWCALSQRFTDGSINQWSRCLQAVLRRMVDILNKSSTSCRHLHSITLDSISG